MFAPIVISIRKAMGKKAFMKFRGKMIARHSRVINQACGQLGFKDQSQRFLRLAHVNGKRLGLLA